MSIELLQAKLDQKLKLLQDRKKLIRNLKNLELVEKEVQQEIDKILPEKRKFEEWARYFGDDVKSKQVLHWFGDEIRKHQVKIERVISMREKILVVQEKIDLQLSRLNTDIEQLRRLLKNVPRNLAASAMPNESPDDIEMEAGAIFAADETLKPGREPEIFTHTRELTSLLGIESDKIFTSSELTAAANPDFDRVPDADISRQLNSTSETDAATGQPDASEILSDATTRTQFFRTTQMEEEAIPTDAVPAIPDKTELPAGTRVHSQSPPFPINADNTTRPLPAPAPVAPDRGFANNAIALSDEPLPTSKPEIEDFPVAPTPAVSDDPPTSAAPVPRRNRPQEAEKATPASQAASSIFRSKAQTSARAENLNKPATKSTTRKAFHSELPLETEFDEFLSFEQKSHVTSETTTKSNEAENLFKYISEQPIRTVPSETARRREKVAAPATETKTAVPAPATKTAAVASPIPDSPLKADKKAEVPAPVAKKPAESKLPQADRQPIPPPIVEPPLKLESAPPAAVPSSITLDRTVASPTIISREKVLYIGLDLGTYETTIAASNGAIATTISAVGWPKDLVSRKMIKKEILFGEDALKHKLALRFYRPLENGVIKDTAEDMEAARALIKYVLKLVEPEKYQQVFAVIGAPAQANLHNDQAILDAAREIIHAVTIVSEPFSVAYGVTNIYNSMVIDIGAGTTDICRLKGTMPTADDQVSFTKAGDYIDYQLIDAICSRIKGAQITKDMARRWKENYSFVGKAEQPVMVEISVQGKPLHADITSSIQKSCESIVAEIVESVKQLICSFDPEFQADLKQNILLAGGGSLIRNLDHYLEAELSVLGKVMVKKVPNPIEAGARGALALAMDLTDDYWRGL